MAMIMMVQRKDKPIIKIVLHIAVFFHPNDYGVVETFKMQFV